MSEITVGELAALGPAVRLVDVREQHEWVAVRVPYAVHVPMSTVPDHLGRFDGAPTFVICHSGVRSARVCEFVAAQGLDVVNVVGGMSAWQASGLDTVGGT